MARALRGLVVYFDKSLARYGIPSGEAPTSTACAPALRVGYFHIYLGAVGRRGVGRCSSIFNNLAYTSIWRYRPKLIGTFLYLR